MNGESGGWQREGLVSWTFEHASVLGWFKAGAARKARGHALRA
jgi:hypothetical protein